MNPSGFDSVAATLYTPLYARARGAELVPAAGFRDPIAVRLLADAGNLGRTVLRDKGSVWRAVILDRVARKFCQSHPTGSVITLGIGLCSRRDRLLDSVPQTVTWCGVDVDPVIDVRRRLLPDDPTVLVAAGLADPSWASQIDTPGPVLVIAEGLLMYLTPEQVGSILTAARHRFGVGTELVADYLHPWIATGAGFRNGRALASLGPDWTLIEEYDVMSRISLLHRAVGTTFRALTGGRLHGISRLAVR